VPQRWQQVLELFNRQSADSVKRLRAFKCLASLMSFWLKIKPASDSFVKGMLERGT
jgi:hypothetical protein